MKPIKRLIVLGVICILLASLAYNLALLRVIKDTANSAKSSSKAVIEAYYLGKISGNRWEERLDAEISTVQLLDLEDRISFYETILLNCQLESASAMRFVNIVGKDLKPLHEQLLSLNNQHERLSESQKDRLRVWLSSMESLKVDGYSTFQ